MTHKKRLERPVRTYNTFGWEEGRSFLKLFVLNPPDDLNELRRAGDFISREEIRGWFEGSKITPDDELITALVNDLNTMRVTNSVNEPGLYNTEKEAFAKFARAVNFVADFLPPKISAHEAREQLLVAEGQPPFAPWVIEIEKALLAAADRMKPVLRQAPPQTRHAAWHDDAEMIVFHLKSFAERRGISIGVTKAISPAIGIIEMALARSGIKDRGRQIGVEAISKAMKRRSRVSHPPSNKGGQN